MFAVARANLREISVADGNLHFTVCGDFLLDFEGICIKAYFGNGNEVRIPARVERLDAGCFRHCGNISTVIFEPGSKLRVIGKQAFASCSSLAAICIPASVEELCDGCFSECRALSSLSFEPTSQLSRIGEAAFSGCAKLSSVSLPASVPVTAMSAFDRRVQFCH
jgi:hypothetical protein